MGGLTVEDLRFVSPWSPEYEDTADFEEWDNIPDDAALERVARCQTGAPITV